MSTLFPVKTPYAVVARLAQQSFRAKLVKDEDGVAEDGKRGLPDVRAQEDTRRRRVDELRVRKETKMSARNSSVQNRSTLKTP